MWAECGVLTLKKVVDILSTALKGLLQLHYEECGRKQIWPNMMHYSGITCRPPNYTNK
jgi:hypothetical protein